MSPAEGSAEFFISFPDGTRQQISFTPGRRRPVRRGSPAPENSAPVAAAFLPPGQGVPTGDSPPA
jgi:hypothetical protein